MPPYRSLNGCLRETFGRRVSKVMLDAGFTCPNADGTKACGGCTYCDAHGSGPGPSVRGLPVREQVARSIERASAGRSAARGFLAYFQAHTNTYGPVERLRALYAEALDHPHVVGLDISTRPDCVPDDVLDLIAEFAERTHVWLELGLQSASDDTLRRINRGHTVAEFVDAVERAHARDLRVCAHVIFGFPWETPDMMRATADLVAGLRIDGVKFHSLYCVPGTPLCAEVLREGLRLQTQDQFAALVADGLERLPPETVIHRLTGDPPPGMPALPDWTRDKQTSIRKIVAELERRGTRQGSGWQATA